MLQIERPIDCYCLIKIGAHCCPVVKNHLPAFIVDYNLVPVIKGIQVKNNKEKNCKDGYSDGFEVNVLHCIPGFYNEDKIFLLNPCILKILCIFGLSSNTRAVMPEPSGQFFCPTDRRYPYRGIPKGSQSPCVGLDTVKGNAVFLLPVLKLIGNVKNYTTCPRHIIGYFSQTNHVFFYTHQRFSYLTAGTLLLKSELSQSF